MNKGLTTKQGQTHTHEYMPFLLKTIQDGEIFPSFIVTHELPLDDAADTYESFENLKDGCIKFGLRP